MFKDNRLIKVILSIFIFSFLIQPAFAGEPTIEKQIDTLRNRIQSFSKMDVARDYLVFNDRRDIVNFAKALRDRLTQDVGTPEFQKPLVDEFNSIIVDGLNAKAFSRERLNEHFYAYSATQALDLVVKNPFEFATTKKSKKTLEELEIEIETLEKDIDHFGSLVTSNELEITNWRSSIITRAKEIRANLQLAIEEGRIDRNVADDFNFTILRGLSSTAIIPHKWLDNEKFPLFHGDSLGSIGSKYIEAFSLLVWHPDYDISLDGLYAAISVHSVSENGVYFPLASKILNVHQAKVIIALAENRDRDMVHSDFLRVKSLVMLIFHPQQAAFIKSLLNNSSSRAPSLEYLEAALLVGSN